MHDDEKRCHKIGKIEGVKVKIEEDQSESTED